MKTSTKGANWRVVLVNDGVKIWSEYFEGLSNMFDERVAEVGCLDR